MKTSYKIIPLPLSLLLYNCGVYQPITSDVPLINHKKDIRVDTGIPFPTFNTTISYGLGKHIALQTYGSFSYAEKRQYWQGAMGYYTPLSKDRVLELYIGKGMGYGVSSVSPSGGRTSGDYTVSYVQLNYGKNEWIVGKKRTVHSTYGVALKVGYWQANLNSSDMIIPRDSTQNMLANGMIQYSPSGILFEPTFILKQGGKSPRFTIKVSTVKMWQQTYPSMLMPYNGGKVALSLNF